MILPETHLYRELKKPFILVDLKCNVMKRNELNWIEWTLNRFDLAVGRMQVQKQRREDIWDSNAINLAFQHPKGSSFLFNLFLANKALALFYFFTFLHFSSLLAFQLLYQRKSNWLLLWLRSSLSPTL